MEVDECLGNEAIKVNINSVAESLDKSLRRSSLLERLKVFFLISQEASAPHMCLLELFLWALLELLLELFCLLI